MFRFVTGPRSTANYLTVLEPKFHFERLIRYGPCRIGPAGIPVTGITPNRFARHCIPGLRYRIMKRFPLLILGTSDSVTAAEMLGIPRRS